MVFTNKYWIILIPFSYFGSEFFFYFASFNAAFDNSSAVCWCKMMLFYPFIFTFSVMRQAGCCYNLCYTIYFKKKWFPYQHSLFFLFLDFNKKKKIIFLCLFESERRKTKPYWLLQKTYTGDEYTTCFHKVDKHFFFLFGLTYLTSLLY